MSVRRLPGAGKHSTWIREACMAIAKRLLETREINFNISSDTHIKSSLVPRHVVRLSKSLLPFAVAQLFCPSTAITLRRGNSGDADCIESGCGFSETFLLAR